MSDGAPWWSRDRRQPDEKQPQPPDVRERRKGRERRGDTRVPISLEIAMPVQVRGENGFQRGLARNISEGGMLLEVGDAPPIGSKVEVTLAGANGIHEGPDSVVLKGEVRHHMSWQYGHARGTRTLKGVGIRFVDPPEEVKEQTIASMVGRTVH